MPKQPCHPVKRVRVDAHRGAVVEQPAHGGEVALARSEVQRRAVGAPQVDVYLKKPPTTFLKGEMYFTTG